jgi:hypothetical protein
MQQITLPTVTLSLTLVSLVPGSSLPPAPGADLNNSPQKSLRVEGALILGETSISTFRQSFLLTEQELADTALNELDTLAVAKIKAQYNIA